MTLRQQQDLLARLYTDAVFRARFLSEPSYFAARFGLVVGEAEALAKAAADEFNWFSDSLLNKRLREVAKMLPLTAQHIGQEEFGRKFLRFAQEFQPLSVKKHLEDALSFADTLSGDILLNDDQRNVVRFESRRLRHSALDRRLSFCLLRFDPRRNIGRTTHKSSRSMGLWVAIGGWSRIFFRPGSRRKALRN